jgi:ligand-binding SRPBCC domain-containing protein
MPVIELATPIAAPVERVFDLARSIDLHTSSTSGTGERAVAGVTSGLIGMGQEVTWRARHFGIWQSLTVRVTAFERPTHFADAMVRGAFRSMEHHHHFEEADGRTLIRDVFRFRSPLGILGRAADAVFLTRYMKAFLVERNRVLKATAESDDWKQYLRSVCPPGK